MNIKNSKIIKFAISHNKPLLGICYGAEILALAVGGTIKKMNSIQKGQNEVSIHKENPLCSKKMMVFESHSYEIASISDELFLIGSSNTCKNEIIGYKNSNIFGVQFHPEMNSDGKNMIEKFCAL